MHTYVKPTGKDNACKGRRVVRLASKVTTGREQKEEKKNTLVHSNTQYERKKEKKRNPETKSNGHRLAGWTPVKAGCK